jgi:hypothetical protein
VTVSCTHPITTTFPSSPCPATRRLPAIVTTAITTETTRNRRCSVFSRQVCLLNLLRVLYVALFGFIIIINIIMLIVITVILILIVIVTVRNRTPQIAANCASLGTLPTQLCLLNLFFGFYVALFGIREGAKTTTAWLVSFLSSVLQGTCKVSNGVGMQMLMIIVMMRRAHDRQSDAKTDITS